MKIKRIDLDSFGTVRDKNYGLEDGVSVFYGQNEAGKTTIMEFIRTTMFPSNKRKKYPAPSKSDAGKVSVEMSDGRKKIMVRNGRGISVEDGTASLEEELKMDNLLYNSVFAMNLNDLSDSEEIMTSDVKSRFLSVPGGEQVPFVVTEMEKEIDSYLNGMRMTKTKGLGSDLDRIETLDNEIKSIQEAEEVYNTLAEEKIDLENQIHILDEKKGKDEVDNRKKSILLSQKDSLETLKNLRIQVLENAEGKSITPEIVKKYDDFSSNVVATKAALSQSNSISEESNLEGMDPQKLISKKSEIDEFGKIVSGYNQNKEKLDTVNINVSKFQNDIQEIVLEIKITAEQAKNIDSEEIESVASKESEIGVKTSVVESKNNPAWLGLGILGIIMAVAGIFTNIIYITVGGGILAVAGIALYFVLKKNTVETTTGNPSYSKEWFDVLKKYNLPEDTKPSDAKYVCLRAKEIVNIQSNLKENIEAKEKLIVEVNSVDTAYKTLCNNLGVEVKDPESDAIRFSKMLTTAETLSGLAKSSKDAEKKYANAVSELSAFLEGFGGLDGYDAKVAKNKILVDSESQISALVESIEKTSGMKIPELEEELKTISFEDVAVSDNSDIRELSARVGELSERMNNILDSDELGLLNTEKSVAESEFKDNLRRWATLVLANNITDSVCNEFYDTMQPSVIKNANSYLELMTCGRYSFDIDPREKDFGIIDSTGKRKTPGEWSSGLTDQAYLSLKLGLAKEMGSERLPMILDDILVRFDYKRKKGACKAITKFAEDQQILLFTCDLSVRDAFVEENANIIEL